jgi:hypothetical protein
MSDQEAREALEARRLRKLPLDCMVGQHRSRELKTLVDPDEMLREGHWRRSLLAD